MDDSTRAVLMAAAVALCFGGISRLARRKSQDTYKRGVVLVDGRALQRRAVRMKRSNPTLLTLAGTAIAETDETKHFKLIGTTGTGKSTAIRELLGAAMERGDSAVFADPDGGYCARFFNRYRGDIVLNPFESCSAKWDPFAEIRNAYDIEQLAGSLIPDTNDRAAGEWRAYARTFLGAVLRSCRRSNRSDCAELWRLMSEASPQELRPVVAGTPAQPFLDPDN